MKNIFLHTACLCTGVLFTGCIDTDNDPEPNVIEGNIITAVVENGASYGSVVDMVTAYTDFSEGFTTENIYYLDGYEVGSSNYIDGGFTIELPATIDDRYLRKFSDGFDSSFAEVLTISDPDLKVGDLVFQGYWSDEVVKRFYYIKKGISFAQGWHIYADRDATVTGSISAIDNDENTYLFAFSIAFKKGWNLLYDIARESNTDYTYIYEMVTTPQSGLKWYYGDDSGLKSVQSAKTAKSDFNGKFFLPGKDLKINNTEP